VWPAAVGQADDQEAIADLGISRLAEGVVEPLGFFRRQADTNHGSSRIDSSHSSTDRRSGDGRFAGHVDGFQNPLTSFSSRMPLFDREIVMAEMLPENHGAHTHRDYLISTSPPFRCKHREVTGAFALWPDLFVTAGSVSADD